jgi:hydroxyacylglutathione hydrolase
MLFERIYDDDLAAASYIVGCAATEQAFVVDPMFDIDTYLDRVDDLGWEIAGVFETHIHADFVSGGRRLARATGAKLYVSAETPDEWTYVLDDVDARPLADGEVIELGNVRIEALHTAGHTPEHLSYLITDLARGDAPAILLSGDFTFVGDLGRPDLLETAAGVKGSAADLAQKQYESVVDTLMELPVDVQIWPGHGSGSACGKSMGSVPASTVGYERKTAWWASYIGQNDSSGFCHELLDGQPETPAYFAKMKQVNRDGVPDDVSTAPLPRLAPAEARAMLDAEVQIVDLATIETFARGHAPGAISLPSLANLSTHGGAVLDLERPTVLHGAADDIEAATRKLRHVGVFDLRGWLPRTTTFSDTRSLLVLDAHAARDAIESGAIPLDVRSRSEFESGHVDGAVHVHYGALAHRELDLSKDANYVTYCGSGTRANIAASMLSARGFNVANGGGYAALNRTST